MLTSCGGDSDGGSAGGSTAVTIETEIPTVMIMMSFSNIDFVKSESYWSNKIFGKKFGEVNHYFNTISYNKWGIKPAEESSGIANDGVIKTYHGPHPDTEDDAIAFQPYIRNAIAQASLSLDFTKYDTNNNGNIDKDELKIFFMASGGDSKQSPVLDGIHALAYCFISPLSVTSPDYDNNKTVTLLKCVDKAPYMVSSSYMQLGEQFKSTLLTTLALIVHELGHSMHNLPDLYDYDQSSHGLGYFSTMSNPHTFTEGTRAGIVPVHYSAWSKIKAGFITPTVISESQNNVVLNAASQLTYNIIKIPTANPYEYYLIENRDAGNYDAGFYALDKRPFTGGLAIWHIDESKKYNDDENNKLIDLVEANDNVLDTKISNGTIKNLFYAGNKAIYEDASLGIRISNISVPGPQMTIDIEITH